MTGTTVLQAGSGHRRPRRRPPGRGRRQRRWLVAGLALVLVAIVLVAVTRRGAEHPPHVTADADAPAATRTPAGTPSAGATTTDQRNGGDLSAPLTPPDGGTADVGFRVRTDVTADPVKIRFHEPPRAGLLLDLDTGQVLWRRHPERELPIASLTKLMTALVVSERVPPGSKVRITKEAVNYEAGGSAVGLLPLGRWVGVQTMLYGLLLPSGNDAAIALAQRAAGGSLPAFVRAMNAKAQELGLRCSHFATPSGFQDRDNFSCPTDLAILARQVLADRRLAAIVRRPSVALPFPTVKGGTLYLANNNPLLRQGYRGTTGLKTGYTDKAGLCLVGTATRKGRRLAVVLLHSPDWASQSRKLLDRGFRLAR